MLWSKATSIHHGLDAESCVMGWHVTELLYMYSVCSQLIESSLTWSSPVPRPTNSLWEVGSYSRAEAAATHKKRERGDCYMYTF